jgi:mannosyltransferase OCH1-like enzyme
MIDFFKQTNKLYNLRKIREALLIKQRLKIHYPIKTHYTTIVPLNIFQTWHSKNLPTLMKQNVENIKRLNPAFTYYLYDDNDCYNFIKDNFNKEVLYAFDNLIPGAYKADLWRYCVLYKLGGIYLDIKYNPVNGFKFINLCEKEHWVLDADGNGVYNALIVCKPNNTILLKAINQIVTNVKTKYYGGNCLEPTGPLLLAKYFNQNDKNQFDMRHTYFENTNNRFIHLNNYIIFKSYTGYLQEHATYQKVEHYSSLWGKKHIYK